MGTLPIQDELPDPMTRDASGNQVELSHHELSLRRAGLIDYAHQLTAQTSHKFFEDEHRLEEWKKKTGLVSNASEKIKPRLKRRDRVIKELARIHRIELAKLTLELDNCFNNDPAYSELKILQGRIKERELDSYPLPNPTSTTAYSISLEIQLSLGVWNPRLLTPESAGCRNGTSLVLEQTGQCVSSFETWPRSAKPDAG
ncbi:hypothetical protein PSTT_10458 [Puccinia striiformis]|uniref:Uncharacterized protein n=1 Tax=Puccinia striiformis TaxID=27350 RepID=A0A2S4V4C0_9BASI|nr:hypothetical protein PSTT_10458 [Puccinia striiformis]